MSSLSHDLADIDTRWLAGLARQLVHDAATAEDLAQDTLLAAVRRPAGSIGDLRAWLTGALRNTARLWHRDRKRRSAREARAARTESTDGTDTLVARLQEQRTLIETLEALPEPYRATLLLRFFEGLPPRRIAARQGVPVGTVQTRLKRGLAQMRERLQHRYGSERAWIAAFLPALVEPRATVPVLSALFVMNAKLQVVGLGLLLAGGLLGLTFALRNADRDPVPDRQAGGTAFVEPITTASAETAATRGSGVRVALDSNRSGGAASVPREDLAPRTIRGRALLADGSPFVGAHLVLEGSRMDEAVTTGAGGMFAFTMHGGVGEIVVADPGYVTVFAGLAHGAEDKERVVVAARATTVDGRVVDEDHAPLAGARVAYSMPQGFRARFPFVLDFSVDRYTNDLTGPSGAFRFEKCPLVAGATLVAMRDGFRPAEVPVTEQARGLELVLARPKAREGALVGRVADEHGLPIPHAFVAAGSASAETDSLGEFSLDRKEVGTSRRLDAVARGRLPRSVELASEPGYLLVELASAAESLSGIVVDETGTPLAGRRIWIADPSYFGDVGGSMTTAEGLSSGGAMMAELHKQWDELAGMSDDQRAERMPPDAAWSWVLSDASGRFRLGGLMHREYQVTSLDPTTLLRIEHGRFLAGRTDLRLVEDGKLRLARIVGHVVDERGRPVAGVDVNVATTVLTLRGATHGAVQRRRMKLRATTGADGAFALENVPARAFLRFTGDRISPLEFAPESAGGIAAKLVDGTLTVTVALRCHLRVELDSPDTADAVQIEDATGTPIELLRIEGTSTYGGLLQALHDGKSGSLVASSRGKTLVLVKDTKVVRKLPLDLDPDRETVVRG